MSLLLSGHDVFDINTDQSGSDCKDNTSQMNTKVNVDDCYCHSVYECKDVDSKMEMTADSISNGRSADVGKSNDSSMTLLTDVMGRGHDEASDTINEPPDENIHRQHGVHSFCYALRIDIESRIRIEQTEDNTDVVHTLQELATVLISRYIPTVKRWLEVNIYLPRSSFF